MEFLRPSLSYCPLESPCLGNCLHVLISLQWDQKVVIMDVRHDSSVYSYRFLYNDIGFGTLPNVICMNVRGRHIVNDLSHA